MARSSSGSPARSLQLQSLTEEAWAPFGWLPVPDTDPRDGLHRMEFAWNDVHVNTIGHTLDEVPVTDEGLRCETLFRHDTHTQSVMALNVPAVIVVAPAEIDFARLDDVEAIRAFRLDVLEPLVLHRGTWHWGPYPVEGTSVVLFNVQGLRYAEDNESVDLAQRNMAVDVLLSS
jgi:ureidoglycolate hydrolase